MKKSLTIGLVTAAISGVAPLAAFAGGDSEPFRAASAEIAPYYERGPRIIHVPQPGEVEERMNSRASVGDLDQPHASRDDEIIAPKPRRKATPQRRTDLPPPRKPYSAPPPTGPRRAVLSAPPPRAGGLSPVYPTPNYEAKAAPGEKFAPPREAAVTAEAPPAGGTPPPAPPESDTQ